MHVELNRLAYLPVVTLGELLIGSLRLFTLERPWIKNPDGPGGMLSRSCVPDGTYQIRPHDSQKFPGTYAIFSDYNGVYYQTRPAGQQWGRTAILIHTGNTVEDVIGCIAVGMRYAFVNGRHNVLESGAAMVKLREVLGRKEFHALSIRPTQGTVSL